jgi:hypothetical protein
MTDILRISVPLTVWLAAFSAVYGLQGLVCSNRWTEIGLDIVSGRTAMIAALVAATALQILFVLALRSPRFVSSSSFVRSLSLTLAIAALVSTLWTLSPVVVSTTCL